MPAFTVPPTQPFRTCQRGVALAHTRPARPARPRPRLRCVAEPPATPDSVRRLITSKGKAEQQKGLLLVRQLPPEVALELLLLCVQTATNEFIRSSAAIAIGQLDISDPATCSAAVNAMVGLLATDADYSVRAAAAAGMAYATSVPPDSLSLLLEGLSRALIEDTEWQVHFSCLASLGNLRDRRAIPVLSRWLGSDNDLLVQAAVGALGDIGCASVVPDLLKLLGRDDMMTRQRLAQSLGHIKHAKTEPAVIDALRTLSRDQSFAVREAASEALAAFGCADPARAGPLSDDEMIDEEVTNLLEGEEGKNAGASASEALRRRLERSFDKEYSYDGTNVRQVQSVDSNGERPPGSASSISENGQASADAMSSPEETYLSDDEYEKLVNDLKHGDPLTQTMAGIQLRRCDGKRAVEAVLSTFSLDPSRASERLRSVCVALLARGGELQRIIRILQTDPDQNVRSACCDALTDAGGGPDAVTACVNAFKSDAHWLVRISAAIALGTIGKDSTETEFELIESLRPGGVNGLESPQDSVVRRHAVTALGFLGSKRSLSAISDLLSSDDSDPAIRLRVAGALRGIHCQESVSLVRSLVHDGDDEVAEMAQGTLDSLAQLGFK